MPPGQPHPQSPPYQKTFPCSAQDKGQKRAGLPVKVLQAAAPTQQCHTLFRKPEKKLCASSAFSVRLQEQKALATAGAAPAEPATGVTECPPLRKGHVCPVSSLTLSSSASLPVPAPADKFLNRTSWCFCGSLWQPPFSSSSNTHITKRPGPRAEAHPSESAETELLLKMSNTSPCPARHPSVFAHSSVGPDQSPAVTCLGHCCLILSRLPGPESPSSCAPAAAMLPPASKHTFFSSPT